MAQEQFRVHARTIDHLGQSQIADCPTAVSELWKNAYDAYARSVALHIFATPSPMAAITDDGHGMSHAEFVQRWLAVGSEHKASAMGLETPEADRNGLSPRPTQGQKGIGRLSVAHLGQVVLVVTKRKRKKFVATLVDWRVFENPHLILNDIIVPVEEFKGKKEFPLVFEHMRTMLSENVVPVLSKQDEKDPEKKARHDRVVDAWRRDGDKKRDKIYETALQLEMPEEEKMNCWPVWNGDSEHGMALFVFMLHRELSVWVDEEAGASEEAEEVKRLLGDTLRAFCDPYAAGDDARGDFKYRVEIQPGGEDARTVISWDNVIGLDDVKQLEHLVEGEIDANGTFNGRIRAFGKDLGPVSFPSNRPLPRPTTKGYVGPIGVLLAAYEANPMLSSMSADELSVWETRRTVYAGFSLYRDGLRVLPYGRPDSDLFEIDAKRGKHAGRYFWAHRRMFARISFTRMDNPNLVDKAGREGLRDNQARRELKLRIQDLLQTLAMKYLGTDSQIRQDVIEEVEKKKEQALKEAGKRARKEIRATLRKNEANLNVLFGDAQELERRVLKVIKTSPAKVLEVEDEIDGLKRRLFELRVGQPPKLEAEDLQKYRTYRDVYHDVALVLNQIMATWKLAADEAKAGDPLHQAGKRQAKLRSQLELKANEWKTVLMAESASVQEKWRQRLYSYLDRYDADSSKVLVALRRKEIELGTSLERFAEAYDAALVEGGGFFEAAMRTWGSMKDHEFGAEDLLRWSADKIDSTNERMQEVHALAQIGITGEIIGHEFESLDTQIRDGLSRLPASVKSGVAFERLRAAHESLSQKLRFLTPLKIARRALREEIRGSEIADYIRHVFSIQLTQNKVEFVVTRRFSDAVFTELRSRFYPVFVNLINNAMYWVSTTAAGQERRIVLERSDEGLIVADSGPGVDPDDVDSIFELFFSRRANGQGVGLYLCRQNLAVGGHQIDYVTNKKARILPGANFVIKIKGFK